MVRRPLSALLAATAAATVAEAGSVEGEKGEVDLGGMKRGLVE